MEKFKKLLKEKWAAYSIATCSAVILYMILSNISNIASGISYIFGIFVPVIYGIVIAYILNPLVKFLEQKVFFKIKSENFSHNASVVSAVLIVLIIISTIMVLLIPQIFESVRLMVKNMDSYTSSLRKLVRSLTDYAESHGIDVAENINEVFDKIVREFSTKITGYLSNAINISVNLGKEIINIVISSILAIYFLIDKKRMISGLKSFLNLILKKSTYNSISNFWLRCNKILARYIVCSLIDAVFVGVANAIFMLICGMPYTVIVSLVVGVTNLAPTFGPMVGGVIGAFILVLINPWYALWFIIFTIILQTIDGYVVKPKFFGNTLGVPGVWILVAIVVGGRLFGVVGILLAIPFAAIVEFAYSDIANKKLKNDT